MSSSLVVLRGNYYKNLEYARFWPKNIVYACISRIFRTKDCCSREDANVNSEGTHHKEGRSHPQWKGRAEDTILNSKKSTPQY